MRTVIILSVAVLFLTSCATTLRQAPEVSTATLDTGNRSVSNDDTDRKFTEYFSEGNYFIKFKKLNIVAAKLLANMPDKGSAKKRLVRHFVSELSSIQSVLAQDTLSVSEKSNSWLPLPSSSYRQKIKLLGRAVQSANVMDRLGIYLSASRVLESDTPAEEFYYTLIAKAIYQLDLEIRNLTLIYPPEQKDADQNTSRLSYTKALVNDVRINLLRSFQSNKTLNIKRIEKALLQISTAKSLRQAKQIATSADYKYAQESMKGLHIMNSSDILGFEDEVELTLSTKFSFEMINELISSSR